jgi:type VI protein secretion system component Hcp
MDEILIRRKLGADSTALMLAFAAGTVIPRAEFRVIPLVSKREAPKKYVSIVMENVQVKSITTGGAATEDQFFEDLVLIFGSVTFEYAMETAALPERPAEQMAPMRFAWNVTENKPA